MRGSKTALLLAPPIFFLIVGLGAAVAIFLANSFFKSGGMGIILPRLTLDNYLDLIDEFYLRRYAQHAVDFNSCGRADNTHRVSVSPLCCASAIMAGTRVLSHHPRLECDEPGGAGAWLDRHPHPGAGRSIRRCMLSGLSRSRSISFMAMSRS